VETDPADAVSIAPMYNMTEVPGSPVTAGTTKLSVFYRRLTMEEDCRPSVVGHGQWQRHVFMSVTGVATEGDPFDDIGVVGTAGDATNTVSVPAGTSTVNQTLVLSVIGHDDSTSNNSDYFTAPTNGSLSGVTEVADSSSSSSNAGGGHSVAAGVKAVAGSLGTWASTMDLVCNYAGWVGAIKGNGVTPPAVGTVWGNTGTKSHVSGGSVNGFIEPAENDLLLCFIITDDAEGYIGTPENWTEAPNSPVRNEGAVRVHVFWRRASGIPMQAQVTGGDPFLGGNHRAMRAQIMRGVQLTGDPIDVVETATGTGAALSLPGATSTVDKGLVLNFVASGRDPSFSGNYGCFSGCANPDLERVVMNMDTAVNTGNGGGVGLITGLKREAGVFGPTTVDQPISADYAAMTIVLKPEVQE
jgi:hypothetical protein